jgi:NDP-hexose-3-ketoreductase
MKKNKILLLGYSNIAKKRYINLFIKKKIKFAVASKSYKKKIRYASEQYSDYRDAIINSNANIVFISLPNSLHYYWARETLLLGYHVIVDKPLSSKISETKELIKIAKKKNKLLSEAIFYNYHRQIEKIIKIINSDKLKTVKVKFIIPMPDKNSLLLSNNFLGGVVMDMGSYASSIHRLFFKKKIISKNFEIKMNKNKLPISFKLMIKYEDQRYCGLFKFGGNYTNEAIFITNSKKLLVQRLFSPPDNINLNLTLIEKNKITEIKVLKDNCFEKYFNEILDKIKKKKYTFYINQILQDHLFRDEIKNI